MLPSNLLRASFAIRETILHATSAVPCRSAAGAGVHPGFRALLLLAVFASMRWGKLAALRRCHVDVHAGTVRVDLSVVGLIDGSLVTGPPKSDAGRRIMTLPAAVQLQPRLARCHRISGAVRYAGWVIARRAQR